MQAPASRVGAGEKCPICGATMAVPESSVPIGRAMLCVAMLVGSGLFAFVMAMREQNLAAIIVAQLGIIAATLLLRH